MSGRASAGSAITRRRSRCLSASATVTTALGSLAAPAFSRAGQRPVVTHGVQSGDAQSTLGMVWALPIARHVC